MFRSDSQVLTNKDDRLSQSTLCNTSFILPNYVLVGNFHFANTNKNLLLRTYRMIATKLIHINGH